MRETTGAPAAPAVLIAVAEGALAGVIAEALSVLGLRTTLAFDRGQALTSLGGGVAVAVLDERLRGADGPIAEDKRVDGLPVILLVDEPPGLPDTPASAAAASLTVVRLPRDTAPAEVALTAARLLGGDVPRASPRTRPRLSYGDLVLDLATHEVRWRDRTVPTTPHQRRLLAALMRAEGSVLSEADLAEELYGRALPGDEQRLAAHVKRLRKQFATAVPGVPSPIVRVRAVGYRLDDTTD